MKKSLLCILFLIGVIFSVSAQKYEAEGGSMNSSRMESEVKGFSGNGCVKFLSVATGSVELNIKIKKEADYTFEIFYALQNLQGNASVKFEIDDLYLVAQKLPLTKSENTFTSVLANNYVHLTKGEHKLKISGMCQKGEWYLDFVNVVEVTDSVKEKIKIPELSNKNATKEAVNLYNYLWEMRGKGILSGQQIYGSNDKEIKVIQKETGKYPAVIGIDLIDFSPSRVERGANGGRTLSVAKKYWEAGGIVTCCWHWNAPMGLVDKDMPEMHWYDGFRTKATTFDFSVALKNQESEEYKLLIRDIDVIAEKLKVLQNGNVPVLWRPLHEASGKWFWWGARGSANYIELYKLLYDRLVNVHKLNNLIWVWNGQDPDWYPGDEYVDIISYDYYPNKYKHGTADEYLTLIQKATTEPKICALSENGALPNVVKLEQEKSVWAWWCTWNGDFTVDGQGNYSPSNTTLETLKLYYENPYTITRDEVPDLK